GYVLSPPISGTPEDRFDDATNGFPTYSLTAKRTVPSLSSPGATKTVEVYGVYTDDALVLFGCYNGVFGYYDLANRVCRDLLGNDISAAAHAVGCDSAVYANLTTFFGVGRNRDGDCIEVNSSGYPAGQLQVEVLPLLSDPALRPPEAKLEPGDLTGLSFTDEVIPARPRSADGSALFPPVTGPFRRSVDAVSGA